MSRIVLLILCGIAIAFAQTKPKAAVYIMGNPEGRDALRMAVNTFLIKSQKYQMIAVDAIDVVAKEQNRQRSGAVSDEDIAELGRDAGARYVCVVERSETDGISYVSTRMVNVETKIAELSEMSELPRGGKIISLIERQINSMLGIAQPEPETAVEPTYKTTYEPTPTEYSQSFPWESSQYQTEPPSNSPSTPPPNPAKPISLSSAYLSFYKPSVTSFYDYKGQELRRNGLTAMLGFESIDENSLLGGSFFIGGGALGDDIKEFILGVDVKKLFWLWKERIAIPISLGFGYRCQWADIENRLVATFINEPKFLQEPDDYLNKKRDMTRHNLDIAPSIDLQIFIGDNTSIYAGYMYRVTYIFSNWYISYNSFPFTVPEELNPLKNSKEQIFGKPGILRFGVKIH